MTDDVTGVPGTVRPAFAGVDHAALTVTDLATSERFWVDVLGFTVVLDLGSGLLCIHKGTGFTLGLLRPDDATGGAFDHRATGLDHLGLAARDRDELVAWQQRLERHGVEHSPIQDEPLGHHLNFRGPDGLALELYAPSPRYAAARAELRSRDVPDAELRALAASRLGLGDLVADRP
ncbi:VOC family protein [Nakamurella leprariae]|uniref:VOC family protein n=1 Tax=Nakamurella leprariae TaxID=2803911 RepID=A0A938YFK3_9ACTN|nr:VOC family protein [Nakamurella leprariae]MBM9466910.1 VOC family protein [Nakamurella leprariae]